VKPTALFVAVGLGWALRRRPAAVGLLAVGIAVTLLPGYAVAGRHALDQTRTAARYASRGTPWRWLASALDHTVGQPMSRTVLGAVAVTVTLALLVLLLRLVDARPPASPVSYAAGCAAAGYLAYLLAAPYVLPWYDAVAWALLAMAGRLTRRPALTWLLLAHTAVLSAAYLTRDVALPGATATTVDALRGGLAPVAVGAVVVGTVLVALRTPKC
jgi:hypothetical protein